MLTTDSVSHLRTCHRMWAQQHEGGFCLVFYWTVTPIERLCCVPLNPEFLSTFLCGSFCGQHRVPKVFCTQPVHPQADVKVPDASWHRTKNFYSFLPAQESPQTDCFLLLLVFLPAACFIISALPVIAVPGTSVIMSTGGIPNAPPLSLPSCGAARTFLIQKQSYTGGI